MSQLNLSRLPADKKQFAWQWLQDNRPELAALVGGEFSKLAQKTFDADVTVELKPSEIEDMRKKFALVGTESV